MEKRIKGIPLKKLVCIKSVVNTVAFLALVDNSKFIYSKTLNFVNDIVLPVVGVY